MSKQSLIVAAGIALIAAALSAPVREYGLVWDDPVVLQQQLPRLNSLRLAFFPPHDVPELAPVYYRPLVVASYLFDRWRSGGGDAPRTFHIATALWHLLACVALLGFARRLVLMLGHDDPRGTNLAAAVALLFATTPIHVDAVAAISGRADLMAALFTFTAAWAYLAHLDRGRARSLVMASAGVLAAALSKEAGLAAVPLLVWLDLALGSPAVNTRRRRWAALAIALGVYAALRVIALSGASAPPAHVTPQPWTVLAAFGWYVRKLLWPLPQSPFVPTAGGTLMTVWGALSLGALVWVLWRAWRRGANAPEATGLLLFLAALTPALCVPLLGVTYLPVAERYLYLPSAGAYLALVLLGARRLPVAMAVSLLLVASLLGSLQTFAHQPVWRDPLSLWSAAREFAPSHHIPHAMLGRELAAVQRWDDAESSYRRGIDVAPDGAARAVLRNNLGSLQRRRGGENADHTALQTFRTALTDDPTYWPALYNFALTQLSLARGEAPSSQAPRFNEAIEALARAESVAPDNLAVRLQLARTLAVAGRRDDALRAAQRLVDLAPASAEAREARELLRLLKL